MATRGKKPTPTATKKARGNPGKRPLSGGEPTGRNILPFPEGGSQGKSHPQSGGRSSGHSHKNLSLDEQYPPPDWLDRLGAEKWVQLRGVLAEMRVLTEADLDVLANCCEAYAKMRAAAAIVAADGMITREETTTIRPNGATTREIGAPKKHPAINIEREYMQMMRLHLVELGLTPSARTRVRVPFGDSDPLGEYLNGIG